MQSYYEKCTRVSVFALFSAVVLIPLRSCSWTQLQLSRYGYTATVTATTGVVAAIVTALTTTVVAATVTALSSSPIKMTLLAIVKSSFRHRMRIFRYTNGAEKLFLFNTVFFIAHV